MSLESNLGGRKLGGTFLRKEQKKQFQQLLSTLHKNYTLWLIGGQSVGNRLGICLSC